MLRDDFLLGQIKRLVAAVINRRGAAGPKSVALEGELGEMLRSYAQLTPELVDRMSAEAISDLLAGDDALSVIKVLSVALLINEMDGTRYKTKAALLAEKAYVLAPDDVDALMIDFPLLEELFE